MKKAKEFILGALVGSMAMGGCVTAFGSNGTKTIQAVYKNIKVMIDGKELKTDKEPFTYEGTTYLPVRAVAEAVGKSVKWDSATQTVILGDESEQTQPVVEAPAKVVKSETKDTKAEPEEKTESNAATISKAEFEKLKTGMSYKEAVEIIGGAGEMLSETGTVGEELHTVMYMWKGEGQLGANANIMFQNDKLNTKAQAGLK